MAGHSNPYDFTKGAGYGVSPGELPASAVTVRLRRVDWRSIAQKGAFGPARMALLCQVSLRQMERFFALEFGCTPHEWVINYRLTLAKELLAEGASNKEVVAQLHFASPTHLCHEFKKFHGVSPREIYRRDVR